MSLQRLLRARGRALVQSVADKVGKQFVQLSVHSNDVRPDVERLQAFGTSSWLPNRCEAFFTAIGANKNHTIMDGENDPKRPAVDAEGDHLLYAGDGENGARIYLKASGGLRIEAPLESIEVLAAENVTVQAGLSAEINCQTFTVNASNISLNGVLTINGKPFLLYKPAGVVPGSGFGTGLAP